MNQTADHQFDEFPFVPQPNELATAIACRIQADGTTLAVNAAIEPLAGYQPDELIHRHWWQILHPGEEAQHERLLSALSQAGSVTDYELTLVTKNGQAYTTCWNFMAVPDAQGQIAEIVGFGYLQSCSQCQLQARPQHMETNRERLIHHINQQIHQSLDLSEILQTTVREARQYLECDRVIVYQLQQGKAGVVLAESADPHWPSIQSQTIEDCDFTNQYAEQYAQGRVQAITDVQAAGLTPCHRDMLLGLQIRANLVVSIVQNQRLWGLLIAHQCSNPRQWQPSEIEFLTHIATQAAIAIQKSQLYQQAQSELQHRQQTQTTLSLRLRQERLLAIITQRIRQSLDLDVVLQTTVAEVREFIQTDRVILYQFNPDWSGVVAVESVLSPWMSLLNMTIHDPCFEKKEHTARYQRGEAYTISDIYAEGLNRCYLNMLESFQVRSNLVVPILQDRNLWGLLIAHHCRAPRQWQSWEVDLLRQLADQVAIALQQAELYQQVQMLNSNLEQTVMRRTRQLQQALKFEALIRRITDIVRSSLDEDQILANAVQELGTALDVIACNTGIYDSTQQSIFISHEYTNVLPPIQGTVHPVSEANYLDYQMLKGVAIQACDLGSDTIRHLQRQYTILACPMADDQGILGSLWLLRSANEVFEPEEQRLVQQIANHCAIALRQARLYKAAQTQVEELEMLNQLKDDFLSTVSHELRTPMSSIQMATEMINVYLRQQGLLNDEITKQPTTQLDRYLAILYQECQREISLINDLLDLSRLDAQTEPLALMTIQPQFWLAHIAEPFIERTRQNGQQLRFMLPDHLPGLETDVSYFERIFSELLTNACKYTPRQDTILLAAHATDNDLVVHVENSGIEIAEAERDRIFDRFYRIPSSDPWRHEGTGLGLALVKKLVEYLGGSIRVESGNQRTCFIVELPLTTPHTIALQSTTPQMP
ncbi:MAG: GAF domain-containing protein [Thainema sp.]